MNVPHLTPFPSRITSKIKLPATQTGEPRPERIQSLNGLNCHQGTSLPPMPMVNSMMSQSSTMVGLSILFQASIARQMAICLSCSGATQALISSRRTQAEISSWPFQSIRGIPFRSSKSQLRKQSTALPTSMSAGATSALAKALTAPSSAPPLQTTLLPQCPGTASPPKLVTTRMATRTKSSSSGLPITLGGPMTRRFSTSTSDPSRLSHRTTTAEVTVHHTAQNSDGHQTVMRVCVGTSTQSVATKFCSP